MKAMSITIGGEAHICSDLARQNIKDANFEVDQRYLLIAFAASWWLMRRPARRGN